MEHLLPSSAVLETERLLLKEVNPEVWNYIFTHLPDADIMSLLALKDFIALEAEKQKFRNGLETYRLSFKLFLLREKNTGFTIGKIGYHNWYKAMDLAEVGYGMDRSEYKQKGYMKEAMNAVLQFGFDDMGLHRVEALLSPQNTPSRRLVEHFGFTYEGLLREHYLRNGIYENSAVYGLLRSEYYMSKKD